MLTSLIKQRVGNYLVCFAGFFFFFTENTDIFLDLGTLVSQVTECIHVNLKPFCDMRPQITQYINAECVQTHIAFSCASCTQTFKNNLTEQKQTRV